MAEHNALKYGTTITRAVERVFGVDDGEQGLTRVSESLGVMADLWSRPEWALERGEVLYSRAPATAPAVVARNSIYSLVNPGGSGIIACVTKVRPLTGASMEAQLGTGGSVAANPVVSQGIAQDSRYKLIGESSILTITSGDVVAGVALPQWAYTPASTNQLDDVTNWIILPGFKVDWINLTQNNAFRVQFQWWERKAFPGELLSI